MKGHIQIAFERREGAQMTRKPWAATEEAHLRKWAGIALVTQIAADLNRTNSSIYKKMHALKLKGVKQGEKHSQAKTTRVGAAMIKLLHDNGYAPTDIYYLFEKNPTIHMVRKICAGRSWKNTE